ncbi:thioester reductase domain-containing protein [Candidatus Tisiphia endosymbiont of Ceraclea dissimilis]|uniref:thioester reductase domain-containing protein n=1 Tax=Candidatus Tisiphia endosymbiont of Ceraclea dissimilis TaxID=3077928 RepID=UPI003CCB417F
MVPSAFVHLEKVPLTTNGKLDRKALPEPGFGSTEGYVAPSNELEKTLSKIWTGVLDLPKDKIGVHDNFFNLGGNSITAIKLVANCKSNNIKINIKDIFNHYTIAKLANFIANLSNKKAFDNQETQLLIDDIKNNIATKELKKEHYINSEEINNILLTGVTGFLGSHMLIDLLNCTNANIYCIVRREANITTPKERLNKILTFAGYEHYINNSRIVILEGDLSKPNLGLSVSTIEQLSLIIDHIYHCGAQVHHLHSYKVLRAVNILATVELLKLSTYKKIKPLHYISTKDTESSSTSTELPMFNMGYIQSKWVSEKILESYIQKNYPIYIYRPGNITGHSSTGFCLPEKNHALLLLKGFIQQKIAPDWNKPFEMVPVDKISRAIVSLSLNSKKLVKNIFNLANHETISWATYISKINKLTTLGIKVIDSEEWRLNILSNIDLDNAIYPLKDIYIASPMDSNYKPTKDQETKEYLEMLQISYPTIEQYDDLLRVYLRYLTKVSFLKLPIIKD